MSQELHLNVLDPQFARYIELRDELEEYLVEIYGPGIDFQVSHECDRWIFYGPYELDQSELQILTQEVVARRQGAS